MRNINTLLQDKARTSIFIAHRLRTVVEAGRHHTHIIQCDCLTPSSQILSSSSRMGRWLSRARMTNSCVQGGCTTACGSSRCLMSPKTPLSQTLTQSLWYLKLKVHSREATSRLLSPSSDCIHVLLLYLIQLIVVLVLLLCSVSRFGHRAVSLP